MAIEAGTAANAAVPPGCRPGADAAPSAACGAVAQIEGERHRSSITVASTAAATLADVAVARPDRYGSRRRRSRTQRPPAAPREQAVVQRGDGWGTASRTVACPRARCSRAAPRRRRSGRRIERGRQGRPPCRSHRSPCCAGRGAGFAGVHASSRMKRGVPRPGFTASAEQKLGPLNGDFYTDAGNPALDASVAQGVVCHTDGELGGAAPPPWAHKQACGLPIDKKTRWTDPIRTPTGWPPASPWCRAARLSTDLLRMTARGVAAP